MSWYMLTLVGKDRLGIVAKLSTLLFEAGGMLGEAAMVRLGGNFAVMLMVRVETPPDTLRATLQQAFPDLHLHLDLIEGELHHHQVPDVRITVHGADRAGIVAEVSSALAAAGCNIVNLDSDVGGSAEKPFYIMQIEGVATQGIAPIEAALARISAEHKLDIQLSPVETVLM